MNFFAQTDKGKIRKINEDSYFARCYENSHLLAVVADGMGGHNGGKFASELAIKVISESFDAFSQTKDVSSPRKIKQNMISAIKTANKQIFDKANKVDELSGMGTTVVMCYVKDNTAYVLNIGDSRLYLLNNSITQITKDHSYVNELVEHGVLNIEDAKNHPQKNLITRALGTEKDVDADLYEVKIQKGDALLLCSDGLSNMLNDEEILNVIKDDSNFEISIKKLIDSANKNGGKDNITAILVNV